MTIARAYIHERRPLREWEQILDKLYNAGTAFYELYDDIEALVCRVKDELNNTSDTPDTSDSHDDYDLDDLFKYNEGDKIRFACECSVEAYEEYMQITEGLFNEEHD